MKGFERWWLKTGGFLILAKVSQPGWGTQGACADSRQDGGSLGGVNRELGLLPDLLCLQLMLRNFKHVPILLWHHCHDSTYATYHTGFSKDQMSEISSVPVLCQE